jgi:hypothetical protein
MPQDDAAPPPPAPDDSSPALYGGMADLGRLIKSHYPQYNSIPDEELGRTIHTKFPDKFSGFVDAPAPPAAPLPTRLAPVPPGQTQLVNSSAEAKNVPLAKNWLTRELIDRPMLEGASNVVEGIERMADPGLPGDPSYGAPHRVGGASQALRGGMGFTAPILGPAGLAESIPGTVVGLGAGTLAGKGVEAGANALGVDPNYSAAAGDVAGIGAGVAAGMGTKAFSEARLNPGQTMRTLLLALRPGTMKSNLGFNDDLAKAAPEIKHAIQSDPNAPSTLSLEAFRNYIDAAKKTVWSHYEGMLGPRAKAYADTTPVADAMTAAIPKLWRKTRPGTVQAIEDKADLFRGPHSIGDISDFLTTQNLENNAYFGKYPADQQAAARADPEVAPGVAMAKSLKSVLLDYLNQTVPGEPDLARDVRRTYGSLISVGDAADHRQLPADMENAKLSEESKLGRVWNAGKALLALKASPMTSARYALKAGEPSPLTIDGRINLAFRRGDIGPARFNYPPDYPMPYRMALPRPAYRAGVPSPGTPIVNVPMDDASSVRAVPLAPHQAAAAMRPALPSSSFPTGASGVTIPNLAGEIARGVGRLESRHQLPAGPQPAAGGPRITGYESPGVTPEVTMDDPSGIRITTGAPLKRAPLKPLPSSRGLPAQGPSREVDPLGSSSGDITDWVVMKDPTTGKLTYFPRPKPLILPQQAKGGAAKSDGYLRGLERKAYSREAALRGLRRD